MKPQISRQPKMYSCREKTENSLKNPNSFSVLSIRSTDIAVQLPTELCVYKVAPASRQREQDTTIKYTALRK